MRDTFCEIVIFKEMKKFYIAFLLLLLPLLRAEGQDSLVWRKPVDCGYNVIQNQAFSDEINGEYIRLPKRAEAMVRPYLWDLAVQSTGLAVFFYSDAPEIYVRYGIGGSYSFPHMPATGVSGIDMFRISPDGECRRCFGGLPRKDSFEYRFQADQDTGYHKKGYEYRLYLPLCCTIENLEIGVPSSSEITFLRAREEKPVVLYGTSIAHGACATRPGLAWATILERSLDMPLVNLGFSGNGKLEPELIDLINEIDSRLIILDCIPNLCSSEHPEDVIRERTIDAVRRIRQKHPEVPVLLMEHSGFGNMLSAPERTEECENANRSLKGAYSALKDEGIQNLHYITREERGLTEDCWVDYVHLNDYGMYIQAKCVETRVREILDMPVGDISTMIPVTQRREPDVYEWLNRHSALCRSVTGSEKKVIIGDSITHYWKGEGTYCNGGDTWERYMDDYLNLGFGWDRIENMLWRVYHGALDGFAAEEVIVLAGANNVMNNDTDEDIVRGLEHLLAAIKVRQPDAEIKVCGLLPIKDREDRIRGLNQKIRKMAVRNSHTFINPGKRLLKNGKYNIELYKDGIHPNAKGYECVVKEF